MAKRVQRRRAFWLGLLIGFGAGVVVGVYTWSQWLLEQFPRE